MRAAPATLVLLSHPGAQARTLELPCRPLHALVLAVGFWVASGVLVGLLARAHHESTPVAQALAWSPATDDGRALRPIRWASFAAARRPQEQDEAAQRAAQLGLGSRPIANDLMRARLRPSWIEAANELGPTPARLHWPVDEGAFVRGFGSGEDGYHLAVDVGSPEGTPVRAAAAGLVAYADDGVRGYGNLIFLVHPGGLITSYAHNSENHVVPGQLVRAGQVIGRVGSTGISQGPHVHFEFMYDRKNCDPLPLFLDGGPGLKYYRPKPSADWTDEGAPRRVRCERRRRHPHTRYEHSGH